MALHMLLQHQHLTPADARADVAQSVVVPHFRVLVVRCIVSSLRGQVLREISLLFGGADQRPPTRGGDHLVAVEGEAGKRPEGAAFLSLVFRTQRFGRILQHRNLKFAQAIVMISSIFAGMP
jgi:hypothetical protein